jgi:hypothetical protein
MLGAAREVAMLLSMHLADVGLTTVVRTPGRPDRATIPGCRWAQTAVPTPLGVLRPPDPRRLGMLAAWADDDALDRFLDTHPLADTFAGGWHVRLAPLQAIGAWPPVPELGPKVAETDPNEPVAVVTLGRLKLHRFLPFFRANQPAAKLAVDQPGALVAIGLARPPRFVATFSLWRTAAEMIDYAYGNAGAGHRDAAAAQHAHSFHHDSCFVRLRPYGASGRFFDGREPLAEAFATR